MILSSIMLRGSVSVDFGEPGIISPVNTMHSIEALGDPPTQLVNRAVKIQLSVYLLAMIERSTGQIDYRYSSRITTDSFICPPPPPVATELLG